MQALVGRVVADSARGRSGGLEHRAGQRRRSRQPALLVTRRGLVEQRFEELAHDAEREARLELAAACAQDPCAVGQRMRFAQQAGLAQPAGGLEHDQRAGAGAGALERRGEGTLLLAALQ